MAEALYQPSKTCFGRREMSRPLVHWCGVVAQDDRRMSGTVKALGPSQRMRPEQNRSHECTDHPRCRLSVHPRSGGRCAIEFRVYLHSGQFEQPRNLP